MVAVERARPAAGQQVDGLVIGKTPCAEAIRGVYAQDLARMQALPDEDAVAKRGVRVAVVSTQAEEAFRNARYRASDEQQAFLDSIAPWAKEAADKLGVAPEHARMFLHLNHYVHWIGAGRSRLGGG